jgi:hypothetical protein
MMLAALRPRPEEADRGAPDNPAARSEWFRSQRAYPFSHIPAGARLRSLRQLDDMKLAEMSRPRSLTTAAWTLIGPQPTQTGFSYPTTSGRVTALAVVPGDSSIAYLGAADGGVWKTTNGGASWTPLTDTQASLATGSIAIDPVNTEIIYVGTGEEDFSTDSYFGAGVLKSVNGGSTWTLIPGPFGSSQMDIGSMAVDPSNDEIVLAGTNNGLYQSTNGGSTWNLVLSGIFTGVLFNPAGTTAYAALGNPNGGSRNGIYVSQNSGTTWTLDNGSGSGLLPSANVGRIALAISSSSPSTLFAGIANSASGSLLGLYQTTNGGSTWTQVTSAPNYCAPYCWYTDVVAVDPTNSKVVFLGGSDENGTLFQSLNGGATWTNVTVGGNLTELHEDHHALAFSSDGGTLYAGNDGGAWSTTDPTTLYPNWNNLNATLATTQFYPGNSIAAGNPSLAYAGAQDNGVQQYSGSATWNYSWCGDGGWTAINPTTTTTVYASCAQYDVEKSTENGVLGTWSSSNSGINTGDRMPFIPSLVMDPLNPQTLYFGTYRVYQTTNGAGSWQPISPDLTTGTGIVTVVSVAPGNDSVVYAGTGGGRVQISTNANAGTGATWTLVNTGLPNQSITQIAISPVSPSTAYAAFSGFSSRGDHIFETTNSGATWTDISVPLPDTPVNDLVIDPVYPGTLYAATDIGTFYTTNNGATWSTLGTGLPNVVVLGLKMYAPTRTLYAATHGRSMWTLNVSSIQ